MSFHIYDTENNTYSTIYDEEELSNAVFNSIKYYREQTEHFAEKNKEWRENAIEKVNDELKQEIASLKLQLSMSYGEFSSQHEKDAYLNFQERHMHDRLTSRAHGGMRPYLIPTHTGIGTVLKVVCPICGQEEDITDMEVW